MWQQGQTLGAGAPYRQIWRGRTCAMIAASHVPRLRQASSSGSARVWTGWTVDASADPQMGWVIALTHPASAGLIIETGTAVEADAVETGRRVLAASAEIDIASAAPVLEHADLVMGLRTVAMSFGWESREVRAVAFLMFERPPHARRDGVALGVRRGRSANAATESARLSVRPKCPFVAQDTTTSSRTERR